MNSIRSILLIISGSIAAYKVLTLIRDLRERDIQVRTILTRGGEQFVTPLSVASLSESPVYTDLFSLKDETEMGHIRLSRESDLVLVAPASADILAKMAAGLCDDLATTALLATDKPVYVAPAMNLRMWQHPATQRNIETLKKDGITFIGPGSGALACGETGEGRMLDPEIILETLLAEPVKNISATLTGKKVLVTSGPTRELIDPVRYLSNHSSGKQGHAIAAAFAGAGAEVTLISGPTQEQPPENVRNIPVQTAEEMYQACEAALPADIAICTAAVSDWKVRRPIPQKMKKRAGGAAPALELVENPDILHTLSHHPNRPALVIGFAAETENLQQHAEEKRERKGCDWILANDVSNQKVFGQEENHIYFLSESGAEMWPEMNKREIARRLVEKAAQYFREHPA